MSPTTEALIDYWKALPGRCASSRRGLLEATRRRIVEGEQGPEDLLPFALADADEDVVFAATSDYICAAQATPSGPTSGTHDAAEWIRRGLAINRGAVFAALLAREDDRVNEALLPLRLSLSADDLAVVRRRVESGVGERARGFLAEWRELLAVGASPHADGSFGTC
jgi:hypothetical protein